MQQQGRDFEAELGHEFGLEVVPGSGSQWHSKLDLVTDSTARWSLKFTGNKSFSLTQDLIDEAVDATEGLGGDGSVPVWAIRLAEEKYDLIILRKNDFKRLQEGELKLIKQVKAASAARSARARVPVLLRDEDED